MREQHRQESDIYANQQHVDMSNGCRDSQRQGLIRNHISLHAGVHRNLGVLGSCQRGDLNAREVQKARPLEVEYVNKMRVVERVAQSLIRAGTGKEPIKVRWVDTLKKSGMRSRLVAKRVPLWIERWVHACLSEATGTCEADHIAGGNCSMGSRMSWRRTREAVQRS